MQQLSFTLDRTDFGILQTLQDDARISNKDLAAANGISPSTCLERVRRLRASGAIRGFRTEVDPSFLGIQVQAMIAVRMNQHANVSAEKLRDGLLAIPEVTTVYLLAGSEDILVHVAVRDVAHLRRMVFEKLTARSDVSHLETSLIFECAQKAALPNYALGACTSVSGHGNIQEDAETDSR